MFATLGPISFDVIDSPESMEAKRDYTYAEHKVVEARPRLQWLAEDLEEITLDLGLQSAFTDPAASLASLRAAARLHQAMPLVFANGVHRGSFVITSITETAKQLSAAGDPIAINVRVVLKEYAPGAALNPAAPPQPTAPPIAVAPAAAVNAGSSALTNNPTPPGAIAPNVAPSSVPLRVVIRSVSI